MNLYKYNTYLVSLIWFIVPRSGNMGKNHPTADILMVFSLFN